MKKYRRCSLVIVVGDSATVVADRLPQLLRNVRAGSSFLSNDRAFLRLRDGVLGVRSCPARWSRS